MDMLVPVEKSAARPRILLVEDDDAVRRSLQLFFHAEGYEVRAYASPVGLAADTEAIRSDCLVADLVLPGHDALKLLAEMRKAGWEGPAMLISGFLTAEAEARALAAGFEMVLSKPIPEHALSTAIARLFPPSALIEK